MTIATHIACATVRAVDGSAGGQPRVVGHLWEVGGKYRFAYATSYRLSEWSVPLDPTRLPLVGDGAELYFDSDTDQLDGALRVFGSMVPGSCADQTCFAWLGEVLCDLDGGDRRQRNEPLTPLTRLCWATALRTYPAPLFGLAFDPDVHPPRLGFAHFEGIKRSAAMSALWARLGEFMRRQSRSPQYNPALLTRGPAGLSDELRRWVLPLPGATIRARHDVEYDGQTVKGYLTAEKTGVRVLSLRVQYAHMAMARECGVSVARQMMVFHGDTAFLWREAVLPCQSRVPRQIQADGRAFWQTTDGHPGATILPMPSGEAVPYGFHPDPIDAADGWMADTTDPRAYEGHPPVTGLIRLALAARLRGDQFDTAEAFRRIAFCVLSGHYTLDVSDLLLIGHKTELSTWISPASNSWTMPPLITLNPALCPLKTQLVMHERLISQAMGYAGRLGIAQFEASSTILHMIDVMQGYDRFAEQARLTGYEHEPTRPVVAYKRNEILGPAFDKNAKRRGRRPGAQYMTNIGHRPPPPPTEIEFPDVRVAAAN